MILTGRHPFTRSRRAAAKVAVLSDNQHEPTLRCIVVVSRSLHDTLYLRWVGQGAGEVGKAEGWGWWGGGGGVVSGENKAERNAKAEMTR